MGTRWARRPGNNPDARRSGTPGSGCRQNADCQEVAEGARRNRDGVTILGRETALGFRDGPTLARDPQERVARSGFSSLLAQKVVPGWGLRGREPPCGWRRQGLDALSEGSAG